MAFCNLALRMSYSNCFLVVLLLLGGPLRKSAGQSGVPIGAAAWTTVNNHNNPNTLTIIAPPPFNNVRIRPTSFAGGTTTPTGLTTSSRSTITTSRTSTTQLYYVNDGQQSDADLIRQAQQQKNKRQKQKSNKERKLSQPRQQFQPIEGNSMATTPATTTTTTSTTRTSLDGVSLASNGFYAMLRCVSPANKYLPLQVTDDPADATGVATSPESLTLIQLLSGVDMAGAILSPDILAKYIVLECERMLDDDDGMVVVDSGGDDDEVDDADVDAELMLMLMLMLMLTPDADADADADVNKC